MTSSDDLLRQARSGVAESAGRTPKRRRAVVTCMDIRVDPLPALSLRAGDAHVIRNAGGVITDDVLRSLIVSQRKLHTTAIDVMMHTDCGMLGLDEEGLADEIAGETGRPFRASFHGFADLETELRRGVEVLRASAALPRRDQIRGHVFDVTTQRVRKVVV
jgi:carbonic anhydrase